MYSQYSIIHSSTSIKDWPECPQQAVWWKGPGTRERATSLKRRTLEGQKKEGSKSKFQFSLFYQRRPEADLFTFRIEKPNGQCVWGGAGVLVLELTQVQLFRSVAWECGADWKSAETDMILKNNKNIIYGPF